MDHQQPSQIPVASSMVAMTSIHSAPTTPTVPSHPPTPSPKADRHDSYPPMEQLQQPSPSYQGGSYYGGAYQTMAPVPSLGFGSAAAGNGSEVINKPVDVALQHQPTSHLYSQYYHQYPQQPMYPVGQLQPPMSTSTAHGYQPLYSPTCSPMVSPSITNPSLSAGTVSVTTTSSALSIAPIRTTWSPAPMTAVAGADQDSLAGMLVPIKAGSTPTSPINTDPSSLTHQFFANGPASAPMYPPPPFNSANGQSLPPLNIVMSSVYQGSANSSSVPTMLGGYAAMSPVVATVSNDQFSNQQQQLPHAQMHAPPAPASARAPAAPGAPGYRVRLKPPMPYPMLLALCILEAPNARLTLRQIYEALRTKYPEIYRETARRFSSWENTVRYNLSRCGIFEKLARRGADGTSTTNGVNEPSSKGSWWTIKQEWRVKIQMNGLEVLKELDGRRHESKDKAEEGDAATAGSRKKSSKAGRAAASGSPPQQSGAAGAAAEPATTTEPLAIPGMFSPTAASSMTDSLGLPALTSPVSVTSAEPASDFSGNGSLSPVMVTGLGSGRGCATAHWGQAHVVIPAHGAGPESIMSSSASVTPPIHSPVPSPRGFTASPFVGYTGAYYIPQQSQQQPNESPMPPAHFVSPYACIVSPTTTTNGDSSSPVPFGSYPQQQQQQQQQQQYQYQYPPTYSPMTYMPPVCLPEQAPMSSSSSSTGGAQQSLPDWAASVELLNNNNKNSNVGSPSQARHAPPPPPQLDPMPSHHYSAHSAYETHSSQAGASSLPLAAVSAEGSSAGGHSHLSHMSSAGAEPSHE